MAAVTIRSDFRAQKEEICHCFHLSPSICHKVMGLDAMILVFLNGVLRRLFPSPPLPSSRDSLVPLHFLSLEWYHLHIWGHWYFSWQSWFQLMFLPVQRWDKLVWGVTFYSNITFKNLITLLGIFTLRVAHTYLCQALILMTRLWGGSCIIPFYR